MNSRLEHAPVRVPPPLLFLLFVVAALALNWLLPLPEPWASLLRLVGGIGVLVGFGVGSAAVLSMMRAKTTPDPHRPTAALVTNGPYRYSRNPIYLGFLLISVGFTLLAGTLWGLLLSPLLVWVVTTIIIRAEEGYLAVKFADAYAEYKSRARRWI